MTTKKQKEERRDDLVKTFFQSSLALISSFVFTTALIGGCGYLLFSYREQENLALSAYNDIETQLEGVKAWGQMIEPSSTGWFSTEANAEQLGMIMGMLDVAKDQSVLESTFSTYALDWCNLSLKTISIEKGRIDGITISGTDYLIKEHQVAISQAYALQISVIQDVRDLISNWEGETNITRANKLNAINDKMNSLFSATQRVGGQGDQIVSAKKLEEKQLEQKISQIQDNIDLLNRKRNWSIFGMIVGVIWLIALAFGAKRYYFN